MANQDIKMRVQYSAKFDTSKISEGLKDIKKQVTNANISDELKKQFEAAFNKLQVNIPALEKLTSKEDFNLKDIEALQKLLKEVTKDWENLNKVTDQIDLSKTFSAKDIEKINNLDKQIKQTQDNIQKARKELVAAFAKDNPTINVNNENVSKALTELFTVKPNEIDGKFKEIQEQFAQGVQQTQTELENKLKGANIQKTGSQILEYFFGKDSGVEFAGKIGPVKDQLNLIIKTYRDAQQKGDIAGMAEQVQKLNEVLTNTANFKFPEGYKLFGLPTQKDLDTLNQISGVLKKVKELAEGKEVFFTEEEVKAAELMQQKVEAEAQAEQNSNNVHIETRKNIKQVGDGFKDTSDKADDLADIFNKAKAQSEALEATFGGLARRITSSISALTVFNKAIQIVHKAIASVKELDAAFTQIAIVSEKTNEEAWQMFDSFNKLAKQYSITTKDLTEGAKLFYQQGLSAADTMKMVEASTISAALGEVTMTEAANTLTAAIQGYNESAAVAMDYTDKIAMVGAVSAADFNELSAAMEKTASSAYTAGLDFDNLLGYLGKMIEVTREAPANLGTAMKTIIARFEDMKKDPMAILEDGVSANKVETALKSIGVALRDTTGEFRPLQDVFLDLGMKWDSLTRNQQAYIATVAAGSRQQSRFLAIFNNFDRTLELVRESQNSAGAAARQYATYQDSAAAATARLTAAWEEFYSKIANPETITNVINLLTKLVEVMNKIGPAGSAAIAVFGAHTINKVIKGDWLSKIINSSLIGDRVKSVAGEKLTLTIKSVFEDGIKLGIDQALGKNDYDFSEYQKALIKAGQIGTEKGILQGIGKAGTGIGSALPGIVSGLGKVLSTLGLIAVVIAAIVGTYALMGNIALKMTLQEENRLKNEAKLNKEFIEQRDIIKKQKNDIKDNLDIYNKYENRVILTNEELQEQNEAVDILKENNNKLIVTVDELGKKHILNKEILEDQTKELEKQEKATNLIIAANKLKAVQVPKNRLQDLSVEQLVDSGFVQEEAELLNQYGDEIFKYRNNNPKWYNALFSQMPNQSLYADITKEMKKNKVGSIDFMLEGWDEDLLVGNIDDILKSGDLEKINDLILKLEKSLEMSDSESVDNVLNFIIKKAELARDGLELLDGQIQKYANSIAGINLDFDDNILQNDVSNLISNIDLYGDGELFEIPSDVTDPDEIEKIVNQQVDAWNDSIKHISSSEKQPFHDFINKLLDPTLSQSQRTQLILEFQEQYNDLYLTFQELIEHFSQGSKLEQERRKQLTELLGGMNLDNYNMSELTLIDRLIDNSSAEKVQEGLSKSWAENYIKGLSNFKQDVIENPAIYKPVHDATIKMWQDYFGLDELEATNLFEEMYGNFPEIALATAKEKFNKAKENLSMTPTQSLSDEQYGELEKSLGESLRYYVEINDEGEKYLTLAGRLAILEKERLKYEQAIVAQIQDNEQKIQDVQKAEGLTEKEQQKQINNYKKENELLEKQKKQLEEIKRYSSISNAMSTNISYADTYYNAVDAIKAAEEEAKKSNGRISMSTAETLKSMNAEYALYLNLRETGEGAYYELTEENSKKMRKIAIDDYNKQLEIEKQKLDDKIKILEGERNYFQAVVDSKGEANQQEYEDEVKKLNKILEGNIEEENKELVAEQQQYDKSLTMASTYASEYEKTIGTALDNLGAKANDLHNAMATAAATGEEYDPYGDAEQKESHTPDKPKFSGPIDPKELSPENQRKEQLRQKNSEKAEEEARAARYANAQVQIQRINKEIEILSATKEQLKPLAPDLEDVGAAGGKTADEMEKLADTLEDLADALEDLDDLLKEVKKELKDIDVDYNPFTDLFEAWEHEWDYYYNIKRLLQQIDTQGQYIDNIISADYASADKRIEAEQVKMGNILAKMAANDTYIEALRTGMSKTAVELMKDYGQYYKVDPTTGQLYQTDKNLNDINELMNQRAEEIYNLQKLQNEKENDLALEEVKLDALEQEKSAYEDILSTIESQLDKLKDDENITVDVSGLEKQKTELEAKVEVTDQSIEDAKDKIRDMEDEIQEIEVDITLKDQDFQKLEDYVSDMEDKVSEYEEYWENLNSTIAEQQELLQSLAEMQQGYIDTAISTQQALYNAIVENYQNEINKKKEQYDYLKQLDNDYLKTIKDNISKERQAREDANKQKEYQKNVQRAQLLQMDTSGAYRNELADLNKEIENQRQDLYDDLVDKQVEALEKEIEKRHELYDKEVQALEERLAYYQENAIILWEMVNSIVAEGTQAMMATLENTAEYMNSSELAKDEQRKAWEYDVQKTFEGVHNNVIQTLDSLVEAGNKFIVEKYPEVGNSLTEYKKVFDDASKVVDDYNSQLISSRNTLNTDTERATQVFQGVLDSFMTTWNDRTNEFTGYAKNWEDVTNALKEQTSRNLEELESLYDSQGRAIEGAIGSIEDYDEALRNASAEIYQDFINERQSYRDQLEILVGKIETDISAAVRDAAAEIRQAASNLSVNPDNNDGNGGKDSEGGGGFDNDDDNEKYKITGQYRYTDENGETKTDTISAIVNNKENAVNILLEQLKGMKLTHRWLSYTLESYGISRYLQGGLASFTGPAWLDGTKANPERVLSPKQTKLFESMVSSLERTANNSNVNSAFGSSYNIGDINTTIQVEKLDNDTDINKVARQVEDRIMKSIRNRVTVSVK